MKVTEARINKIENGWTVYLDCKTTYFKSIIDALEYIETDINLSVCRK